MIKTPKNASGNAERAAEWYAHEIMGCIKTVRAVRARFQRQDLFSCDCIGKRADGSLVALQVTASDFRQAVDSRKRKIANEFWHSSDTVQILQLIREEKGWYFKVYHYVLRLDRQDSIVKRHWYREIDKVLVPTSWFRKYKGK